MTVVRQDHHASSVLGLEEFQGVPVLIHRAGCYLSLVADDGTAIERYIGVTVWDSGFQVTGYAGYGYGGRMESLAVGSAESIEAARRLFPEAVDAIKQAPALYNQARDIYGKCGPWVVPLSRHDYESLAAELGFGPDPDNA